DHYAPRTITFGMITSPADVRAVGVIGIDPDREKHVSEIDDALIKGQYIKGVQGNEILIGAQLADTLDVGLGDRVVITVSQAHTGELMQQLFFVTGIFSFQSSQMDKAMVFIPLATSQTMLGIDHQIHEIALQFTDDSFGSDEGNPFYEQYSQHGNEAIGWALLMPQLKAAFELTNFSTLITAGILFGVVALGIINTLFMSLYERMFEFGVLRSVGTRPFQIMFLILCEAGSLALVSIALGIGIGFAVTYVVSLTGIDYTGIEFAGVTFRRLLYPILQLRQFIIYPIWVFIFTVLVGIYPAVYAARMNPIEAMRKSL
ncbi:MAG: FtsX-like permease family protein, partial [Elusimicrobia bacterium]|nr:FtsX-like permease family protein [Elusimicrobiota bacterium]MBD3412560.1 FtsX-like permease family protein [Elusimicrobiota bacterium]